MKKLTVLFMLLPLTACMNISSPMNTEFSCNATAGDSCLNIEEVNEMTKMQARQTSSATCLPCLKQKQSLRRTQSIWIPPMVDTKGQAHHANVVIADVDKNQIDA